MQLFCQTLFPPRMTVTIAFLTYSSYASQSTGILIQSSLLIYCTSVASPRTTARVSVKEIFQRVADAWCLRL